MNNYKIGSFCSPHKRSNILKKSEGTNTDINNTDSSNYIYSKDNILSNEINRGNYWGSTKKSNNSNFSVSLKKSIKNKIMSENTKINKVSLTVNLQNLIMKIPTKTLIKNIFFRDQFIKMGRNKLFFNNIMNNEIHPKKSVTKLIHNSDIVINDISKFDINVRNNFRLSTSFRNDNINDNKLERYKNSNNNKNKINKNSINEKSVTTKINSEVKKTKSVNKKEKLEQNMKKEKKYFNSNDFIKSFYSTYSNKDLLNSSYNINNNDPLLIYNNKKIYNNFDHTNNGEIPINLNKKVYKIINTVFNFNNNNTKGYSIRELHRQIFLSSNPYKHSKQKKIIKINLNKNKNKNNIFYSPSQKYPKINLESIGINDSELSSKIYLFSKRNKTLDGSSFKSPKDKKKNNFISEKKKTDALDEGLRNYKMDDKFTRKIVINCETGHKKEKL